MKFMNIIILITKIKLSISHTWVDRLECSCPENNVGYPRSYLGRQCINDFDTYNTFQIDCRKDSAAMCSPHQSINYNFDSFPKLKCAPGSTVSLYYNPNGHISKDPCIEGDPRGCRDELGPMSYIYIASNKDIYPDEIKTRDQIDQNTGLNLPGYDDKLQNIIAKFSYDADGTCQEDSDPCKISFKLPMDLKNHTDYQFVFYHVFDRNPFADEGEAYTSCMTIHSHMYEECSINTTPPPPNHCK